MPFLSPSLTRAGRAAKAAALALCGVTAMARGQLAGQGAVLTFHGLREDGVPAGVRDESLHLRVSTFRAVCRHLAERYRVMPLTGMADLLSQGEPLPPRAVALTFDDGYASNYHLGFPILHELGLPATIFLATGFVDRCTPLWFQQVDRALDADAQLAPSNSLEEILARLKTLPDAHLREHVSRLPGMPLGDGPAVTRPLNWDQVREMHASGLVEFGGHTHTHPVLARCTLEQQRLEIETCRDRITAELGKAPRVFAFPNGKPGDYAPETLDFLTASGFESAWTMINDRVTGAASIMEMPRYGAPGSVLETEATVSGAFELLKQWKGRKA